jgi:hypothetical protein
MVNIWGRMFRQVAISSLLFTAAVLPAEAAPGLATSSLVPSPSNTIFYNFSLKKVNEIRIAPLNMGDLNGDGKTDFMVGIYSAPTLNELKLYTLSSDSTGSAQIGVKAIGKPVVSMDRADFNGDGKYDVAVATTAVSNPQSDGNIQIYDAYNQQAICSFNEPAQPQSITFKEVLVLGDVNNNGTPDIAVNIVGAAYPQFYHVVRIIDGGNCQAIAMDNLQSSGYGAPDDMDLLHDINGDGKKDFVAVINQMNPPRIVALSGATGQMLWVKTLPQGYQAAITPIDFRMASGAIRSDIAVGNSGFGVSVLNGNNGSVRWSVNNLGYTLNVATVKDINNDGQDEVLVQEQGRLLSGANGAMLWQYNGIHPFTDGMNLSEHTVSATRDLNGDGIVDIAKTTRVSAPGSLPIGTPAVLIINGRNGKEISFTPTGQDWSTLYAGIATIDDANGNGTPDVIFAGWDFNTPAAPWCGVKILDGLH